MRAPLNYFNINRNRGKATETPPLPDSVNKPEVLQATEFILGGTTEIDSEIARTIFFDQEINEESATMLRAQLMAMSAESPLPIRLMLGSPGGGLYESLAVYDTINLIPNDVIAICSGKVMSGGILILLACDHRVSTENTTFMMHHGHTTVSGNVVELKEQVAEIDDLNNKMLDQIIKQTNITRDQLDQWLLKDHYLNATQAKKLGLITKIIRKMKDLDEFRQDQLSNK